MTNTPASSLTSRSLAAAAKTIAALDPGESYEEIARANGMTTPNSFLRKQSSMGWKAQRDKDQLPG